MSKKVTKKTKNKIINHIYPQMTCIHNLIHYKRIKPSEAQATYDEMNKISKDIKEEDKTFLIDTLTSNIMLLQHQLGHLSYNAQKQEKIDSFQDLSKVQIKMVSEIRKTILALDSVITPKKTTFIKEANQQNNQYNLTQEKTKNENELDKNKNLIYEEKKENYEMDTRSKSKTKRTNLQK